MKNEIALELGRGIPHAIVEALPTLPGLCVRAGGRHPMLRAGGQRWRLLVQQRPADAVDVEQAVRTLQEQARRAGDGMLPLVMDIVLPERLRRALERREISYIDGSGSLHVVAPGVIVHVERRDSHPRKATQAGAGLGAVSVRAVQRLLTAPTRAWTVTELAAAASISLGQAHNVLALLQQEGLVTAQGSGRGAHRVVRDPPSLVDWLAAQRPARRVHEHLACAFYASSLPRLCARVTQTLDSHGVPHAWTAAAAAALQEVGPTAVPRAVVRVDPEHGLMQVAGLLGSSPTDRGANLLLWRDVGRVGVHGAQRHPAGDVEVPLAAPIRVYLDLLGERRGEDLAAQYREAMLGY